MKDWARTLQRMASSPWPRADRQLTFRFDFQPSCSEATDLTIYAGAMPEMVRETLAKSDVKQVAFAARTHYEESSGWSRGYIWLSPDRGPDAYGETEFWKNRDGTYLVMLHELGHVFGLKHDAERYLSVMRRWFPSKVARRLQGGPRKEKSIYRQPPGLKMSVTSELLLADFAGQNERVCSHILGSSAEVEKYRLLSEVFGVEVDPFGRDLICVTRELGKMNLRFELFPRHPLHGEKARSVRRVSLETAGSSASSLAWGLYRKPNCDRFGCTERSSMLHMHQLGHATGELAGVPVSFRTVDGELDFTFFHRGQFVHLPLGGTDGDYFFRP